MVTTPTLWGSEVAFSSDPNAFGFQATGLADNNFTIVWSDTLGDIHGRRFEPLGSFNSTDFLFNLSNSTPVNLRLPHLIQLESGSVRTFYSYLAGSADEDIYVNFADFDTTGGSTSGNTIVNSSRDEFQLDAAAVEFNNQAAMATVYTQLRGTTNIRDLYLAYETPAGYVIGSPIVVPINAGESVSDAKVVGLPNGTIVVTYTAQILNQQTNRYDNYVRYRIYNDYDDLSGARNASSTPGNDTFPAICALDRSSDGFVIATQDPLGIRFLYHAFGQEFTKSVPGTLSSGGGAFPKAISPKITALHDQGFIIAWTDTSDVEGDGSPALKIVLQRFDKNATAIGDNLIIDHPGDQSLSSIATLADGRVIVVFDNETGDSTNHFTHDYQIIDPRDPTINGTYLADNIVGREDGSTIMGYEGADTLSGRMSADSLDGGAGADTITGAGGADTLAGGADNDTYVVNFAGAKVVEAANQGYDVVETNLASYTLAANVERLNFTDTGAHTGKGNDLSNRLNGNAGADKFIIDGGGNDIFSGGLGEDSFDARSSTVAMVLHLDDQTQNAGSVAGDTFASIERFFGSDTAGDRMTTGAGRAKFFGFGGNDTLTGGASIDALNGGAGNDRLIANAGQDALDGGVGNDTMTGGAGADMFTFVDAAFGKDVVTDFEDGVDVLKVFSSVADNINDFTISGNGTSHVVLTLKAATANTITLDSANHITITASDFLFY